MHSEYHSKNFHTSPLFGAVDFSPKLKSNRVSYWFFFFFCRYSNSADFGVSHLWSIQKCGTGMESQNFFTTHEICNQYQESSGNFTFFFCGWGRYSAWLLRTQTCLAQCTIPLCSDLQGTIQHPSPQLSPAKAIEERCQSKHRIPCLSQRSPARAWQGRKKRMGICRKMLILWLLQRSPARGRQRSRVGNWVLNIRSQRSPARAVWVIYQSWLLSPSLLAQGYNTVQSHL